MPVQFSGVDWEIEEYKAEIGLHRRSHKRKARKMEEERLRRFRRFLHGMNRVDLREVLTDHVVQFFYTEGNIEDNRERVINDLASDNIFVHREDARVQSRHALTLLRTVMWNQGRFSPADDFLESLFSFSQDNLQHLVESQMELFRGPLELIYATGDERRNVRNFVRGHLRVGHLGGDGEEAVMELRQLLLDGGFLIADDDGAVSMLSGSHTVERPRWWRQFWRLLRGRNGQ